MAPPPINAKAETSLRCPYCRRDDCYVPVTDDWPARAREAYERGEYEHAPTCALGQVKDMARLGWCHGRASHVTGRELR